MRAKSIALEGIDGTGKSTLAGLLKDALEKQGLQVLPMSEPGGSSYYQAIREHIHFTDLKRSALSDALTCAGGIAENIRLSQRAVEANQWVITDRCYLSNLVHQVAQGLDEQTVRDITNFALQGFKYDIKILIDVPLETAHKRLLSIDKKKDRWETMGDDYFQTVKDLYLKFGKKDGFVVLDGRQPLKTLLKEILSFTEAA